MRSTFRFFLTEEDYINFEKMQYKRVIKKMAFPAFFFVLILLYNFIVLKNYISLIFLVGLVVFAVFFYVYLTKVYIKKKVNQYLKMDSGYFLEQEITVDEKNIELKNIPKEREAGFVCIYPYSIMPAIFESEEYFYFYVSNEVKILPKKVIPQEFKDTVFALIKKNRNYVYIK